MLERVVLMLDKVSVVKRKEKTIVARVNDDLKDYLDKSAKRLNVSSSAYLVQLIENDRNPNVISLFIDDDIKTILYDKGLLNDDSNLEVELSSLIRKEIIDECRE
jgi:hypothetical protein